MIWAAVLATSLGCYLVKLLGVSVPERWLERERVRHVAALLPVALLAALTAVQTVGSGQHLTVDARLAGLAAGITALLLRAPFIVVVVVAAATAGILRALGWAA